jgi:hypothetical protein
VRDDGNTRGPYRIPLGCWEKLLEAPPAEVRPEKAGKETLGAVLPVVIKVRVPTEARPGLYEGRLTVGGPVSAELPVRLEVIDWKLPGPREFVTHMGLIQSPESVAMHYEVPFWSDRHWQLLEKSFELLGEVGNRYLCVPLICHTNFGNSQSMVRWIKAADGGYTHDFTVLEKYLDLARKHQELDVVCLYCWDLYCGRLSWGKDRMKGEKGPVVSLLDPASGKVTDMEAPKYGSPEAKAFWEPVCKGVRERLKKRGLLSAMMVGVSAENRFPTPEPVKLFAEFLPGVKWIYNGHPCWRTKSIHGMPIGYSTAVYIKIFPPPGADGSAKFKRTWQNQARCSVFPRSGPAIGHLHPNVSLGQHRTYLEAAQLCFDAYSGAHYDGLGRVGADFWPVIGGRTTLGSRYPQSEWKQLNLSAAIEALLAPGPDGAVTTERFESIREGLQVAEARIFVQRALEEGKLDAALAGKCREVLDERTHLLRVACITGGWIWYSGVAPGLSRKLFAAAAEVAAARGQK